MLITRLLNKLLQDVQQTKKAYYTQVERACNSALQDIRSVGSEGDNEHKVVRKKSQDYDQDAQDGSANLDLLVGEEVRPQCSVDSEKFYVPFELACKGDVTKITVTALDGIQKLVAYGELIGDYPDPKTPTRRLIDRIVDTVCSCHIGVETDEGTELQIIKALLTIVTSEHVHVHESTLLLILRTCYIIHLTTKSAVNQRTARAMLTQMLHSIFQRMEAAAEAHTQQSSGGSNFAFTISNLQEWEAEFVSLARQYFSKSVLSVPNDLNLSRPISTFTQKHSTFSEPTVSYDSDPTSQENGNIDETVHRDINVEVDQSITSNEADKTFDSEVESTVAPSIEATSTDDDTNPFSNSSKPLFCSSFGNNLTNALQKDAFLCFWALTKLALKPLNKKESENDNDKNTNETKFQQAILAFHLIKEILERSGKVFKESPIFVNAMKQHLCQALLENGISTSPEVFKLEIEIIMIIMAKFTEILVDEVQVLLDNIVFPVLRAPTNPSLEYNKIVLKSLKNIAANLECFVYLYLTCDHDASNELKPYQKMVSYLAKSVSDRLGNEELAVEIIANLLKSMSEACPKLEDSNCISEVDRSGRLSSMEESPAYADDLVEALEIEGKDFLTCLCLFLEKFTMPCDVLKVDWLIQKLAQRMTDTSSVNSFRTETADCWYALIYASMSLIADIKVTYCQGKSKMSKTQFVKLNRAINGCEPLDETCLSSIYDEIEANYGKHVESTSDQKEWGDIIGKNEEEMLEVIKYILETTSLLRSHFSLGKHLKHVKRMFKICGTSFLIALISALQSTYDVRLSEVCLDGIHSGIRVACILGLDIEKEAYVQALAKMSVTALDEIRENHIYSKLLTTKTSTRTLTENGVTKTVVTTTTEMKCRSVDIILTLLDVGIAEGNHLGGSWLHILKFMSQLLSTPLLVESRNSSRSSSPVPPAPATSGGSGWVAWAGSLKETLEKKLWDPSAATLHPSAKEAIVTSVEKVFKRSEMLTGDAMTEFFQALCQVSLHDMMNSETPRHLMYQKINEVADGNFYRPALQWSQIWQVVADYFCHLACSSREEISTLAMDSIQNMVVKLLKKETLNGYRFQNHFLLPLKVIITNTRSQSTREAVLGFVETVISLHGDLLLSGWIAILSILVANMLSHSDDKDASTDSFRVLQHIVDKCQKGEVNLRNSFASIVKSLSDIASNIAPTLEMSEQAFRLLTQMAEIPFRHPEFLMEENDDKRYRVWARGWKPILAELSAIICNDTNEDRCDDTENEMPSWDIKTKALITLFEIIKTYGSSFEGEWWNSVFEVLFNIFNYIKSHEKQDLMFAIFDVYTQYYDATTSYVFDELVKHLQWCICQDHEQIALSGVSCLQQWVVSLGDRFSVNQWDSILNVFQTICKPSEFLHINNNLEYRRKSKDETTVVQNLAIRAIIQLELLKIMNKIIFCGRRAVISNSSEDMNENSHTEKTSTSDEQINPVMTNSQISLILEILNRSHEIAKDQCIMSSNDSRFESQTEDKHEKPNFIAHETLSLQIYSKILFTLFKTDSQQNNLKISQENLWEMIQKSCIRSCGYFVTIQRQEHRDAWADLLCFTMDNIMKLPKPNFETITSHLYPYFCEMLELEVLDMKICDKLREYLLMLGNEYNITLSDLQGKSFNRALENDSHINAPKTCNNTAQNHFQRTCLSDTISEAYVNQSKDFQ